MKPHKVEYWLNRKADDPQEFVEQVTEICDLYQQAKHLHNQGRHLISVDEKTGIQALERIAESLAMKPGKIEKIEYEYVRHGTQCLIANLEVASGEVLTPTVGGRRSEVDFVSHIAATIATDEEGEWIFISDQLNTHQSEGLVRLVAEKCRMEEELGEKGKSGVLKTMSSRAKFLRDKRHRIRFVYTPKHSSWLNQIEIWFSILERKLLKRSSFKSVEELREKLLSFIEYFNKTMAKPFKWSYTGRPLSA